VVAPQGTALTADHARILRRYTDQVVLCFDGDKAGQDAAVRALDDCLGSGLAIKVASIPPPDDPDSYLKAHGAEAFRQVLSGATEYFDYYLAHLCSRNDPRSDRGRVAITRAMAEKLRRTGNAVLVEDYAKKTAFRLAVSAEAMRVEFRKATSGAAPEPAPEEPPLEVAGAVPEGPPPPALEQWLVKFLCHADLPQLEWAAAHLDPGWMLHPVARRVVEARLHQAGAGGSGDLGGLIQSLGEDDTAAARMVTEAAAESRSLGDVQQQLAQAVRRLRDLSLDRQITALKVEAEAADLSPDQYRKIVEEGNALRMAKRQPLSPLADC
jgi:DNA primase